MNDDRTAHLNLPLPHRDNLMTSDVQRIRDALAAIDAALALRSPDAEITAEIQEAVQAAVQGLLDGAPGALDTLN